MISLKIQFADKIPQIMHGIIPIDYLCRSDGKFSYSTKYIPFLYSVNKKYTRDLLGKEAIIQHNYRIKFKLDII